MAWRDRSRSPRRKWTTRRISSAVAGFGRYPDARRPRGLRVAGDGSMDVSGLAKRWGEKRGLGFQDIVAALRQHLCHADGSLRFSLNKDPVRGLLVRVMPRRGRGRSRRRDQRRRGARGSDGDDFSSSECEESTDAPTATAAAAAAAAEAAAPMTYVGPAALARPRLPRLPTLGTILTRPEAAAAQNAAAASAAAAAAAAQPGRAARMVAAPGDAGVVAAPAVPTLSTKDEDSFSGAASRGPPSEPEVAEACRDLPLPIRLLGEAGQFLRGEEAPGLAADTPGRRLTEANRQVRIPVLCLRFSSGTLQHEWQFDDGRPLAQLAQDAFELGQGALESLPPLEVFVDGKRRIWCFSTRRLAALRMAQSLIDYPTLWAPCVLLDRSEVEARQLTFSTRVEGVGLEPRPRAPWLPVEEPAGGRGGAAKRPAIAAATAATTPVKSPLSASPLLCQCVGGPAAGQEVKPGDRIVAVNNTSEAEQMLAECRGTPMLKLTVARGDPGGALPAGWAGDRSAPRERPPGALSRQAPFAAGLFRGPRAGLPGHSAAAAPGPWARAEPVPPAPPSPPALAALLADLAPPAAPAGAAAPAAGERGPAGPAPGGASPAL